MQRSPPEEPNNPSVLYQTWCFVAAFTRAHHLSPSWTRSVEFMPFQRISLRVNLILSFHLFHLPNCLFSSDLPTKTLYAALLSPIYVTYHVILFLLDLITWMVLGMKYKSLSSSLCNFLQSPVTSSLLEQNLSTLLFNILSLYSSPIVRNGFSHPFKMIHKIIVLYILIFTFFLDNIWEDKRFWTKWIKTFPELNLLLISSWTQFWFVRVVHRFFHYSPTVTIHIQDTRSHCVSHVVRLPIEQRVWNSVCAWTFCCGKTPQKGILLLFDIQTTIQPLLPQWVSPSKYHPDRNWRSERSYVM